MNLHHKMTHSQASKKWENLKKKYKVLKNPPDGVKVFPDSWPYFKLMDDAMLGRLEGSAPILKSFPFDKNNVLSKPQKRKLPVPPNFSTASFACESEIEVSLNGDDDGGEDAVHEGSQEIDRLIQEVDNERDMMDNERLVMEREKQVMERERMVLQRERAVLDREIAALDRDRASLDRERATLEREKVVLEREKALVERDRDAVSRDKLALEREKARFERLFAHKGRTEEESTEDSSAVKDSEDMGRKERFLNLFEKLIENF
ncbi:apical junction molecule isoform X2 [Cheilinus undulatus]|nr:apical junction molecule isoform X2 [Cheilinus undulatus]